MKDDFCPVCGKRTTAVYTLDFLDEPEALIVSCLCDCGKREAEREEEQKKQNDLKLRTIDYIRKNKSVSWAELEYFFDRIGFDYRGRMRIHSGACENVILWDGWNYNAITLIEDVTASGKVRKAPAGELVYLLDGKVLNYPIVQRNRAYKKPHWLPMIFEARGK